MSNVFDLDSMREALDAEFAPVKFRSGDTEFVLRNLMRVGKKDRTQVMNLMKELQELQGDSDDDEKAQTDDPEVVEKLQDLICQILALVTADNKGPALVEQVGDDLQLVSKIMDHWQEATQAGEAEDSPS